MCVCVCVCVCVSVPLCRPVGDRGSTMVKVLCYKLEGRWFKTSWFQWIFH